MSIKNNFTFLEARVKIKPHRYTCDIGAEDCGGGFWKQFDFLILLQFEIFENEFFKNLTVISLENPHSYRRDIA